MLIPTSPHRSKRMELPAEPASVARARHEVAELAADLGGQAGDIALAVSEAVSNAVQHAYRDTSRGTIVLDAAVEGGALLVSVTDRGVGMSPNPASSGLGLGISIIGKLVESFTIADAHPGTRLRMRFPLRR